MDSKIAFADAVRIAPDAVAEPARAVRVAGKVTIDLRALRVDATWQASSFDLAQGLDVKEMESKLAPETLDRLFRG